MNHEIIKNAHGSFDLIINGQIIKTYARKYDAKRGYLRMMAAATSATGAAQATQKADVAQPPPTSNTGGQKISGMAQPIEANKTTPISTTLPHYIMVNGKVKEMALRTGKGTAAHIDTLTLTFAKSVLFTQHFEQYQQLTNEDEEDEFMLIHAEEIIQTIFGFGFGQYGNGRNGYAKTVNMGIKGDKTIIYGFFGWGNGDKQGSTVCLHLSGVGLTAALDGWETRLYTWIKDNAPYAKITRIDLAHDFLNGQYTPLQAYMDWQNGLYQVSHTKPCAEMAGKGWLNDPQSGRTLYIGSRKNGSRLVRVYEKGIEQGDKESPWVRFELQLRNRDIVIDHEILLYPGEYLTGAYPITQQLFKQYDEDPKKFERIQKLKEISIEHCIYHLSIQAGPTIKALRYMGFESDEITDIIENTGANISKRLHPLAFDANTFPYLDFIKNNKRNTINDFELYQYIGNKYLKEQTQNHTETASKPSNGLPTKQLRTQQKHIQEDIYLRAIFCQNGYQTVIDAGYEYDDYIKARFGIHQPPTQLNNKDIQT